MQPPSPPKYALDDAFKSVNWKHIRPNPSSEITGIEIKRLLLAIRLRHVICELHRHGNQTNSRWSGRVMPNSLSKRDLRCASLSPPTLTTLTIANILSGDDQCILVTNGRVTSHNSRHCRVTRPLNCNSACMRGNRAYVNLRSLYPPIPIASDQVSADYWTICILLFRPEMTGRSTYCSRRSELCMGRRQQCEVIGCWILVNTSRTGLVIDKQNFCCKSLATQSQPPPAPPPSAVQYANRHTTAPPGCYAR